MFSKSSVTPQGILNLLMLIKCHLYIVTGNINKLV